MLRELGSIESELGEDVMGGDVGSAQLIDGRRNAAVAAMRKNNQKTLRKGTESEFNVVVGTDF